MAERTTLSVKEPFKRYKSNSMHIAKDLCFPKEIIAQIEKSTSNKEISRLMVEGRHRIPSY